MFAVIKTGGKQFRVAQDDVIVVEKLAAEAGDTLVFGDVLMIGDGDRIDMGAPLIGGAQVVGEVVEQRRGEKLIIYKKKQRNTYRRKMGHRQHETVIRITEILAKGGAKATTRAKVAERGADETKPKTAAKKAATKTVKADGDAPVAKAPRARAKKTDE
jgi:large subunit ribosomal protein L21